MARARFALGSVLLALFAQSCSLIIDSSELRPPDSQDMGVDMPPPMSCDTDADCTTDPAKTHCFNGACVECVLPGHCDMSERCTLDHRCIPTGCDPVPTCGDGMTTACPDDLGLALLQNPLFAAVVDEVGGIPAVQITTTPITVGAAGPHVTITRDPSAATTPGAYGLSYLDGGTIRAQAMRAEVPSGPPIPVVPTLMGIGFTNVLSFDAKWDGTVVNLGVIGSTSGGPQAALATLDGGFALGTTMMATVDPLARVTLGDSGDASMGPILFTRDDNAGNNVLIRRYEASGPVAQAGSGVETQVASLAAAGPWVFAAAPTTSIYQWPGSQNQGASMFIFGPSLQGGIVGGLETLVRQGGTVTAPVLTLFGATQMGLAAWNVTCPEPPTMGSAFCSGGGTPALLPLGPSAEFDVAPIEATLMAGAEFAVLANTRSTLLGEEVVVSLITRSGSTVAGPFVFIRPSDVAVGPVTVLDVAVASHEFGAGTQTETFEFFVAAAFRKMDDSVVIVSRGVRSCPMQ